MAIIANARAWWGANFPKQIRADDPPGVTVPLWLVNAAKFASWVAMAVLVYFLLLYTLEIARDRAAPLHLTQAGTWTGELLFYFPYIVGFAILAFGIPYTAKIAIPTFMSLTWRGAGWAKAWALIIALCVSLVIIAGTLTVQGETLIERDREAAVAVEGVQQEAAVLAARIADKRAELDDMVNNASVYVRTAASMSPAAYDAFVAERRGDWQYERLRSYRATSVDAQRLRGEIAALRDQQARQTAVASVARRPETQATGWLSATLDWVEGVRAILLALVMDIVCLMMPWIALRLEQARALQMADSRRDALGDDHLIADQRAEAPVAAEPMEAPREKMFDAVTGDELVHRRAAWVRKPKGKRKGEPVEVVLAPEAPAPDDRQAPASATDERVAREPEIAREIAPEPPVDVEQGDGEPVAADEVLDDETAEALLALAPPDDIEEPQGEAAIDLPDGEGVMLADDDADDEDENAGGANAPLIAAQ